MSTMQEKAREFQYSFELGSIRNINFFLRAMAAFAQSEVEAERKEIERLKKLICPCCKSGYPLEGIVHIEKASGYTVGICRAIESGEEKL